jgi:hypothetical protein
MAIGRFGVFLREYSFQKGKEDCWKNTLKAEAIHQQPSTFASENLGHRQPRHSKTKRKIPTTFTGNGESQNWNCYLSQTTVPA